MSKVFGVFFYGESEDFFKAFVDAITSMKGNLEPEIKATANTVVTPMVVADKKEGRKIATHGKNKQIILDFIKSRRSIGYSDLKDLNIGQSTMCYYLDLLVKSGEIRRVGNQRPYRYEVAEEGD